MGAVNPRHTLTPKSVPASAVVSGGTGVEIQAAIDNLTSGRTSAEKVVLLGDFTLTAPITLPSYTILEIQGSLTGTAASRGVIENADSTNTDITVYGGYIDVDNTATPWSKAGIKMSGVSNLTIHGVNIKDAGKHCIDLKGCSNFVVENCVMENAGDDGISVLYSYDGRIVSNRITGGSNNNNGGGSAGIEVEDSSHDIVITNNVVSGIQSTTTSGIHCVTDPGGSGGVYNITISNNVVRDTSGSGIRVISNKAPVGIASMSGTDGGGTVTVTTSSAHGLSSAHDSIIIIDDVDDTGLTSLNGKWVAEYVNATSFTIPATVTGTFEGDGTVYFDCLNCNISANIVDNVGVLGVGFTRARSCSAIGNSISRTGTDGMVFNTGCENCSIVANSLYQIGDVGISLFTNDKMVINDNTINEVGYNQAADYGIRLNTVTNSIVSNNVITGYTEGTNYTLGIQSYSGGTNVISGNDLTGAVTSSGTRVSPTAGDVVRNNVANATRNSGSSGAIATGSTVAHGLVTTPTNVNVTAKDAGVTDVYVTADATNLTINYSGGGTHDFWWEASALGG